jgi:hypothetical protein
MRKFEGLIPVNRLELLSSLTLAPKLLIWGRDTTESRAHHGGRGPLVNTEKYNQAQEYTSGLLHYPNEPQKDAIPESLHSVPINSRPIEN